MTALLVVALLTGSGVAPAEPHAVPGVVKGVASWFCSSTSPCTKGYPPGSMAAAAGSELQTPHWRGTFVTVRYAGKAVVVKLIDVCLCKGSRVIDLYRSAFAKLADPSRGLIPVTVEIKGIGPRQTLPATSTWPEPATLWGAR